MQVLEQIHEVEEIEENNSKLEVISDKYCRAILNTTMYNPKAVTDIARDTKIPFSTMYRRIQMLLDQKLLSISGMISEDGKRTSLYKSKIKGMSCVFDKGQVKVELDLNR